MVPDVRERSPRARAEISRRGRHYVSRADLLSSLVGGVPRPENLVGDGRTQARWAVLDSAYVKYTALRADTSSRARLRIINMPAHRLCAGMYGVPPNSRCGPMQSM